MTAPVARLGFDIETKALVDATAASDRAAQSFDRMGQSAGKAAGAVRSSHVGMGHGLDQTAAAAGRAAGALAHAGDGTDALGASALRNAARLTALGAGVSALITYMFKFGEASAQASDRVELMAVRIANALGTSRATARDLIGDLRKIADEAGMSDASVAQTFLRIARNNETIGLSRTRLLGVTRTLNQIGVVSGANVQEIQGSMVQLSQALSAGQLKGDELRSILESTPDIIKALAAGMGVTTGEIKRMGAEGELTTARIIEALEKVGPTYARQFAEMPRTLDRASAEASNAIDRMLASWGKALKSSEFMQLLRDIGKAGANAVAGVAESVTVADPEYQSLKRSSDLIRKRYFLALGHKGMQGRELSGLDVLDEADVRKVREAFGQQANDPLFAGMFSRHLDRFEEGLAERRQRLRTEREDHMALVIGEQRLESDAALARASAVVRSYDSIASRRKAITEDLEALEKARASVPALATLGGVRPDQEGTVSRLDDAISVAQSRLAQLETVQAKYLRITGSMRAGSGAHSLSEEARQLSDQAADQGQPLGIAAARGMILDRRAVALGNETAALERQVKAMQSLTAAKAQGYEQARKAEIDAKVEEKRMEQFAGSTLPAVEEALARYREALTSQAQAQRAAAAADEMRATSLRTLVTITEEQATREGQRGYALRLAVQAERERQALEEGKTAAQVEAMRRDFEAGERLQGAQTVSGLRDDASFGALRLAAIGDPRREIEAKRAEEIAKARREVAPESRDAVERELREKYRQEDKESAARREADRKATLAAAREEIGAVTKIGDARKVQMRTLEKIAELRRAGAVLDDAARAKAAADAQEEIEQEKALRRVRENLDDVERIGTETAGALRDGLSSAIEEAFRRGSVSAKTWGRIAEDIGVRVMQSILNAALYRPLERAVEGWVDGIMNKIGSRAGGGGNSNIFSGLFNFLRPGGGFGGGAGGGGTVYGPQFATGTILDRRTDVGPGQAGEAGPEAVLPLARGADGRLGVAMQGMQAPAPVINIQDFRSANGSEGVEATSRTGPDGQRVIDITIRDAVRKQLAAGDHDSTLRGSFGLQRAIRRV